MLKTNYIYDYKDCKKYHNSSVLKCPGESTNSSCGRCPKYFKATKKKVYKYEGCATYEGDSKTCTGITNEPMCNYCPKLIRKVNFMTEKPTYTNNPQRKVYNIDFDGVLTTGEYVDWPWSNLEMILKVRRLYNEGNIIIIWSARLWEYAPKLASWLIYHEVPYHGIVLGKGGADFYIDDKAINSNDFLSQK